MFKQNSIRQKELNKNAKHSTQMYKCIKNTREFPYDEANGQFPRKTMSANPFYRKQDKKKSVLEFH